MEMRRSGSKRTLTLAEEQYRAGRLTTQEAAQRLGISPDSFRRLAKRLELKPIGHYRTPDHLRVPLPIWDVKDIEGLVGSGVVSAIKERSKRAKQLRPISPREG